MPVNIHKRVITHKTGDSTTLWYAILELPRGSDGKRKQIWHGGYRSLEHAEAMRDEFKEQIRNGTYVYRRRMTFRSWCEQYWLPSVETRIKPSTLHGYRQELRLYVYPQLESCLLISLTPEIIDHLYQQLLKNGGHNGRALSPATVRGVHFLLNSCLRDAIDLGYLTKNPTERAHPPIVKYGLRSTNSCWTISELQVCLDGIRGNPIEMVIRLAIMTGMRRGEVLGLRWRDVNFETSRVSVCNSIIEVDGNIISSTPKSNRSRTIDIDQETMERLLLFKMETDAWAAQPTDDGFPHDLVFRDSNGDRYVPTRVSNLFNKAVQLLPIPRIRFHDLRHTHASHCLAIGIPINVVQERLGHAKPETTLRLYAHVLPGSQSQAAKAFAHLISES